MATFKGKWLGKSSRPMAQLALIISTNQRSPATAKLSKLLQWNVPSMNNTIFFSYKQSHTLNGTGKNYLDLDIIFNFC